MKRERKTKRKENKEKSESYKEKESGKMRSSSNENKVTESEKRNENREKNESKKEKETGKMRSSSNENKVTESEKRNENKEKSESKKEIENEKMRSESNENEVIKSERRNENREQKESKMEKESEKLKSESKVENRENLNNHVAEEGDSDFEVPEDVCEWFAKNWSHNVFYNLSRGITLRYRGSTRPPERKESHMPITNIAYKQYSILQEIQESPINLIVGGKEFKTSKVTLLSGPDSLLGSCFGVRAP